MRKSGNKKVIKNSKKELEKLLENYRTVLYSDEPLYQKLFKRFTFKDNEYDEIVHFLIRNTNEVIHIVQINTSIFL